MERNERAANKAAQVALLKAANPGLVPASVKVNALVAAARNIRKELAAAFPGVKFSVRNSRYSGGNSLRVAWMDGPQTAQVDEIVSKYEFGRFDGMDDSYRFNDSAWTDAFGGAYYVMTSRSESDELIAAAIRTVKAKYAGNLADLGIDEIKVNDYRMGRLWNVLVIDGGYLRNDCLQALIAQEISRRTTFAKPVKRLAKFVAVEQVELEGAQA